MARLDELDRLLSFVEDHIDLGHIRQIEQLQYDAVHFQDIIRLPLSIRIGDCGYNLLPYDAAYDDPEKMLYNELLQSCGHSPYNTIRIKDDSPLMIRSNHGPGILASLFGCKSVLHDNMTPKVVNISLENAKKIFDKGVPALDQALGKKVIDTCQYYQERLQAYPKCRQAVHITQPDMRGPYDLFHLILGNEAFILPYDDPALTKYILDVLSATYISFRDYIDPYLNDSIHDDTIFIEGLCCGGSVLIKADMAMANLSSDMYKLCEGEPDEYIMKSLGGGSLSYSGVARSGHKSIAVNEYLKSVYFSSSELHHLSSEYQMFRQKGVAIVGWSNRNYDKLLSDFKTGDHGQPILTGLTLTADAGNLSEGIEILNRHKDICYNNKAASA